MRLPLRILTLVLASAATGFLANALSPGGIAWNTRFEHDLRHRALVGGVVPLRTADVERLIGDPRILLIDARPTSAYAEGHLPGAVSFPWPATPASSRGVSVERWLAEDLIVYCGSAYCSLGLDLATELRRSGHPNVALYVDGFDLWDEDGREVEHAAPDL